METIILECADPAMRGQLITRNSKSYRIGRDGTVEVPADCGLHLCGKMFKVVKGEPVLREVTMESGEKRLLPPQGPMVIWRGLVGHVEGQRLTAADGSIVRFNGSGYGMAPDNCGFEKIKGFNIIGPATPENIARYATEQPRTRDEVDQEALDALLMIQANEDEEVDPYEQEFLRISQLPVVPTPPANEAVQEAMKAAGLTGDEEDGTGTEGQQEPDKDPPADPPILTEAELLAQAEAEGRVFEGRVYKNAAAAKQAATKAAKAGEGDKKSALAAATAAAGTGD